MATENEPAKLLLPYLQRADELQKHEPLVSYYCRLYAMERGLKIPQSDRTKTTSALLVSLLNQLEKDKKSLKLAPEDSLYLEGFALNVFAKADKQDRAGQADLNTAKTFYAASIFFEILNQFGPLQPDIEGKQKYAAWKAADIRKALKEGRRPVPGPPGEGGGTAAIPDTTVGDASHLNDRSGSVYDSPSIPQPPWDGDKTSSDSYPSHQEGHQHSASIPSQSQNVVLPSPSSVEAPLSSYPAAGCPPDYHNQPPNNFITNDEQLRRLQRYHQQYHSAYDAQPHDMNPNFQSDPSFAESSLPSVPSHSPWYPATTMPEQYSSGTDPGSIPHSNSNYQPPPERIAEAHKAARFAVGALAFDEIDIAVDYLKKSLELLTNPSPSN